MAFWWQLTAGRDGSVCISGSTVGAWNKWASGGGAPKAEADLLVMSAWAGYTEVRTFRWWHSAGRGRSPPRGFMPSLVSEVLWIGQATFTLQSPKYWRCPLQWLVVTLPFPHIMMPLQIGDLSSIGLGFLAFLTALTCRPPHWTPLCPWSLWFRTPYSGLVVNCPSSSD